MSRWRRVGWAVIAQGASSFSNVAVSLVVARSVGVDEYGAFAAGITVYFLVTEAARALTGETLLAQYSGQDPEDLGAIARQAASFAILVGAGVGVTMCLAGLVIGGPVAQVLCVIGFAMPVLAAQDVYRLAWIAHGQGRGAAVGDIAWLAVEVLLFAVLMLTGFGSLATYTAAWAAGGVASGFLVARRWNGSRVSVASAGIWNRRDGPVGRRVCADFLLDSSSLWGATLVAGVVGGYAAFAALGGARVLLGPVGVLFIGGLTIVLSEGARLQQTARRELRMLPRIAAAVLTLAVLCWTLLLVYGPQVIGEQLLGESFSVVSEVLVPLGIYTAGRGVINMARANMLVWRASAARLRTMITVAPMVFLIAVTGAAIGAGRGAAWALAGSTMAAAMVWTWRSEQVSRKAPPSAAGEGARHV